MIIRRGKLSDLDELSRIESLAFPREEAASRERIASRLSVFSDYFFIMEDGEEIISYINGIATNEKDLQDCMYEDIKMHQPDGEHMMIFSVVTNPEYIHKGYASALMEYVIDIFKKEKTSLVLTCKEPLISFYEKFGYVDEGISSSNHGGVTWHQMRKTM